jgi:hypothetical protein
MRVIHLHADGPQLDWALSTTIHAGMCGLRIFEGILPERFEAVGIKVVVAGRRETTEDGSGDADLNDTTCRSVQE